MLEDKSMLSGICVAEKRRMHMLSLLYLLEEKSKIVAFKGQKGKRDWEHYQVGQ